jgi:hypothetical protein
MEKEYEAPGFNVERLCVKFWCNQHKWGKIRSTDENIRLEIPGVNEYITKSEQFKVQGSKVIIH